MSNLLKPLYTLTVEEYKEVTRGLFCELVKELKNDSERNKVDSKPVEDIIFLEEAARMTGYRKSTIYSKVCRFEIPVFSKGKPLMFSRKAILEWLESGKPSIIDVATSNYLKS
ncbi:MAG: helix-turn-helix domain-containing protein [Crocinitomicaceae bacterium]|nr:helix-turn-helix domain-containing protein [Crocinitomicaceae bacterium]